MEPLTYEMESECQMSHAMSFLLVLSRLFGIAPLRFRRAQQGCRVSISPTWMVFGFICFILSACASITIYIQIVLIQGLRNLLTLPVMLRLLNYWIALYISTVATITASKRMKRLIRNMKILEEIHTKLEHDVSSDGKWWRAWAPIPYTFLGMAIITSILSLLTLVGDNGRKGGNGLKLIDSTRWTYALFIWFMCVSTLLKYHLSFVMMAIYHTLKAINQRLTVYMTTMKEPFKPSPKTINEYGVQYSSVCDVIFVINDKESSLYFATFAQHFLLTTFTIYMLGIVIIEGKITSIILQMLWMLYNLSCIIICIEACHYVKSEMEKSKAIICKVAAKSANKRVLREATDILQQLSLVKSIFSPLGVFSLTRYFIVTSFSVVTTFVVILIQFKLFHE